jgi:hypothetical protein
MRPRVGWREIGGLIIWALLLALAASGAAARPGGYWLGLPSVGTAALAAAAAFALWLASRRGSASVLTGLVAILLFVTAGLPVPGVGALTGPPLASVVLAGAVAVLTRGRPTWSGAVFFPVVLALYLGTAARTQEQVGTAGDEPHYLMVAESLLRDGDLSLEQDYAEGRYRAFHDHPLVPHFRVRGKHGEVFSLHALGLSLLILPAYALGGYPLVSFFMALLAALLARELRGLIARTFADDALAEGAGWALALSPPLIHYAGLVFTEIPAALIVATFLHRERGGEPRPLRAAALGSMVAFLPWLNVRLSVVVVILVLHALAGRPRVRAAGALLLPLAASALALAAYHWWLYGFWDPRRVYGRRPEFSLAGLGNGIPGLFFDQEFGLLVYAPVFALALPGLVSLLRHERRLGVTSLTLAISMVLIAGSWPMWRGGFNPPARFLVPIVPALAVGVGEWLRRGPGAGAALLIGWGLWTGLTGAWEPRVVHRDRDGTAPLFRAYSGAEEWTRLLPGYVLDESQADRRRLTVIWALALTAAALTRGRRPVGPGGVAAATAGLALACGVSSWTSSGRTGGRDSVRVLGRAAIRVPGWTVVDSVPAVWTWNDLTWGPDYAPHRYPDGATLGARLELPPGRHVLRLEGERPPSALSAPQLAVRPEGAATARLYRLEGRQHGLEANFEVGRGERSVTLGMKGGGPFILRTVGIEGSTPEAPPGPIH